MAPITTTIEVGRPAAEVFAYATDPSRFSEWQKGVVDGAMDTTGAPRVGDRCLTTRRIGFASRPVTAEVVRVDPPRTWGVRGVDGPIRAAVDVAVEPVSDTRSRLTISIVFEGHGIGRLLVPLFVERGGSQGDAGQPRGSQEASRSRELTDSEGCLSSSAL